MHDQRKRSTLRCVAGRRAGQSYKVLVSECPSGEFKSPLRTPAKTPVDLGFSAFLGCGVTNRVTNSPESCLVRPGMRGRGPHRRRRACAPRPYVSARSGPSCSHGEWCRTLAETSTGFSPASRSFATLLCLQSWMRKSSGRCSRFRRVRAPCGYLLGVLGAACLTPIGLEAVPSEHQVLIRPGGAEPLPLGIAT